jgi:glycosyltransferase involved in cell wall biosynthesis
MKFSIITPSFKQPQWLKLCLASVADQNWPGGVEHIVQDNCSGPETEQVVAQFPAAKIYSEKDAGMYDAVNRGFARATGDLFAYLNCDEQYLPGGLAAVAAFFAQHPEIDVLFADCVLIKPDGSYLCSRPALRPHYYHTKICHLNTFTAATFFRRKVFDAGHAFPSNYRDCADCAWVLGLMEKRIPFTALPAYTIAFTDTGDNMNLKPNAVREHREIRDSAPAWARALQPWWVAQHRVRKWLAGAYSLKPFTYEVFTAQNPAARTPFRVDQPTSVWWDRLSLAR